MAKPKGGKREGAGRKPKADEQKLIERLDNIIDSEKALNVLARKVLAGEDKALDLYMKYRYGLPKQQIDHTSDGEKMSTPVITIKK